MRLPRWIVRSLRLMDHAVTVVVFTVPEKRLREMDVANGPCVATGGRERPLVGVLRQDGGEFPQQTSALYTALTGRPADEALTLLAQEGEGRLFAASPAFVVAMADAHEHLEALREADLARGDDGLTTFWAQWQALDQAWLAAAVWPRTAVTTEHRLSRLSWAHAARERGQRLYVWHGPEVPMYDAASSDDGASCEVDQVQGPGTSVERVSRRCSASSRPAVPRCIVDEGFPSGHTGGSA